MACTSMVNRLFFLVPFLRWAGNRKAFEYGSFFGFVHFAIWSLSWRSETKLSKAVLCASTALSTAFLS